MLVQEEDLYNNTAGTILLYETKDSHRGYWYITAISRGQEVSKEEPDYYETIWDVNIKSEGSKPHHILNIIVRTQYDEPISQYEIAKEMHNNMMLLYDSLLTECRRI